MAPLPDQSAYRFARRLDRVYEAFIAAHYALLQHAADHKETLRQYESEVAAGQPEIEERDSCGRLIWSQEQELLMRIDDAADALQSLQKAMTISAYHVWEDAARRFTGCAHHYNHRQLVEALEQTGSTTETSLEWICLLVNTLKHGNAKKGRLLHRICPRLFPTDFDPEAAHIDWYGAIVLSAPLVEEIITDLGQSGPVVSRYTLTLDS